MLDVKSKNSFWRIKILLKIFLFIKKNLWFRKKYMEREKESEIKIKKT